MRFCKRAVGREGRLGQARLVGGLATGIGILFLTVPSLSQPTGEEAEGRQPERYRLPEVSLPGVGLNGGLSFRRVLEQGLRGKVAL